MLDGAWLCPLNPLDELDEPDDLLEELVLLDDLPDEDVEEVLEDLLLLDDDIDIVTPPTCSCCCLDLPAAYLLAALHWSVAHFLPASLGP